MNEEKSNEIKVGSPVHHVSDRKIVMGVEEINQSKSGPQAFCSWLNKAGGRETGEFSVAVLRLVGPPPGMTMG